MTKGAAGLPPLFLAWDIFPQDKEIPAAIDRDGRDECGPPIGLVPNLAPCPEAEKYGQGHPPPQRVENGISKGFMRGHLSPFPGLIPQR